MEYSCLADEPVYLAFICIDVMVSFPFSKSMHVDYPMESHEVD